MIGNNGGVYGVVHQMHVVVSLPKDDLSSASKLILVNAVGTIIDEGEVFEIVNVAREARSVAG